MISIDPKVQSGDLVYVWFSLFPESAKNKRPSETEYRLGEISSKRLKMDAPNGGYSLVFSKDMLESWHGSVRKVN